jgi:hypothetical protein
MMMMMRTALKFVGLALAGCAVCALAGCTLAGALMDRSGGGQPVKAKYVPNKQDSMLVLIDTYGLVLDSDIESQHMAITLDKLITDDKIAAVVDQHQLEQLKDDNSADYPTMTIADIGRKVGAKQVLYVHISRDEIQKPVGSGQSRGHMEATVKIVDSATADTRWPVDSTSEAVQITTKWITESENKSESDIRALMADQMAENVEKLFKNYNIDEEATEDQKVNVEE